MIKAIIFDFAGVVATESFMIWLSENIPDFERTKQTFLDLSYEVDSGKITGNEFAGVLAEKTGKAKEDVWPEIFSRIIINSEIIKLLVKLRENYKVALLTNHLTEWIMYVIEYYNLTAYFDEIVISSKEKVIKPKPEIFHITLKRLGIKPQEGVFIDDRQVNVDGAVKIGMKGLLYINEAQLIADLKQLGVEF